MNFEGTLPVRLQSYVSPFSIISAKTITKRVKVLGEGGSASKTYIWEESITSNYAK